MSTSTQRSLNSTSLLLLALAFIAAVIISNELLKGWRIDLTDNKLYTLSEGTKRIVEKIEEPINLYFYFSDRATENIPSLRSYANRVRELLEEIEGAAGSKIKLSFIDPLPFSEEEDRASQFRLQGVQIAASPDTVYMGLAGTNSIGDEEVIPFFQPDKEEFLEYDIAKLISTLAQPERQAVGLISGVRMAGDFNPQTQQMQSPWVIFQQAQQLFDVRSLGNDIKTIEDDIGLLWIVQPKNLPDSTLYAIDQFILKGGKALIFVDPLAEVDPSAAPQGMPAGMPPQGQGSDLATLFDAWGLSYTTTDVVADAQLALQISSGMTGRPVRHLGLLGITSEQLNSDEVITSGLDTINVGIAGYLSAGDESGLTFEPLVRTSRNAGTIPASRFSFLPDPAALQQDFNASGDAYVIAARLIGNFPSAFPDGPPSPPAGDEETTPEDEAENGDEEADGDDGEAASPAHVAEATATGNVIVVADVDILSDRMWVQLQNFFGQQIANAFADNGTFVINSLDSLSGSNDLIDVRSRASYSRPFTRVANLRVQAEARFQETEQRLQRELEDTENRLAELQSSREDSGNILMTEEQQAEIDRFIDRRAEIRQELRAVQRGLDRDIERLGTVLKSINIGLVPLLLTVFVLIAVWRRSRRSGP
jgi:ABC-type uncharacterized transport system involved in gliding motility auxiliary subunit